MRDSVVGRSVLDVAAYTVLVLLGLALCVRAGTHPALTPAARRPWRYLGAGFGLLLVVAGAGFGGSVGGGADDLTPAVLVGLVARVLFLAVLLRGLFLFEAQRPDRRASWTMALDVVTIVGGGLMLTWYFLVGPAIAAGRPGGHVVWATAIGYTVGDLLLVFGLSAILLRGTASSARRPLALLLAGCVGYLAVDVYVTYAALHDVGRLRSGSLWLTAAVLTPVLLMVAAVAEQCRLATRAPAPSAQRVVRRPTWLPYAALVLGLSLLVVAAARTSVYPWWGLVAGAVLITLAVTARQIIALRDNRALVVTDTLTGLASRSHLGDVLRRLPEHGEDLVAVLHIDLDGFKRINDVYGHDTGDAYLVAFADVLRRHTRRTDTAARLGGDEFAVVLGGVRSDQQATAIADRILVEAGGPADINGHRLRVQASIGIAVSAGARADPEDLLYQADQAMHVAKRRQTHGWQLYADGPMEDDRDAMRRLLVDAVRAGQLRLTYQPIVDLASGDLVAVEALVRWQHPTRGLVPPLEFIPLAEETGAIHHIGLWVVDEATRQVVAWRKRLPTDRGLQLSVNLSPHQLNESTLAGDVMNLVDGNRFPAGDFIAEVTESGIVEDATAIAQLEALRARGVRIALDDFGTGYSSLRYLTRLPVDILKLDRCFVVELNGRPEGSAVAEAVSRLAQILHLDTVAEGIEEPSQATELTLYGYRNAQGFHYARPLTAEDLDRIIDAAGDRWPNLGGTGGAPTSPAPPSPGRLNSPGSLG